MLCMMRRGPASLDRDLDVLEDVFAYVLLGALVIACPFLWFAALAGGAGAMVRLLSLLLALTISVGVLWVAGVQVAALIRWLKRRASGQRTAREDRR
jgi:hypothetical protein